MNEKGKMFKAIILKAEVQTADGHVFTRECLQKMADGDSRLRMEGPNLIYEGPDPTPDLPTTIGTKGDPGGSS